MSGTTIAAFWAVSMLFVVTPGADWAYAITAGLRHRSIAPAVAGLLTGHVLATAVVAAGVAGVVARTPSVLTALTLLGAAYLVWLGVGTLRSAGDGGIVLGADDSGVAVGPAVGSAVGSATAGRAGGQGDQAGGVAGSVAVAGPNVGVGADPGESARRQFVRGVAVSGLNPKLLLLFLALLPPFADPSALWPVAAQIVALGSVHVVSCAVVYTTVGVGARRVLRSRPAAARAVTRFSGAAMVVIGVALVVEQVAH